MLQWRRRYSGGSSDRALLPVQLEAVPAIAAGLIVPHVVLAIAAGHAAFAVACARSFAGQRQTQYRYACGEQCAHRIPCRRATRHAFALMLIVHGYPHNTHGRSIYRYRYRSESHLAFACQPARLQHCQIIGKCKRKQANDDPPKRGPKSARGLNVD